jgi:excinuclease ABC subunit C
MQKLEEKLKFLPDTCGVYLMKDSRGRIIYIGEALSLRKRVRSHFGVSGKGPKTRALAGAIRDIEYISTDSQTEALILESDLIKKYRPRYNVRLRDDKKYPYIRISEGPFPAISITRTLKKDRSHYYGPYASAGAVRRTLKLMRELFMLRSCRRNMSRVSMPCLYYHLGLCAAPCAGRVAQRDYKKLVRSARLFLDGRVEKLAAKLTEEMTRESKALRFEKAAAIKDNIAALEKILEGQKMTSKRISESLAQKPKRQISRNAPTPP